MTEARVGERKHISRTQQMGPVRINGQNCLFSPAPNVGGNHLSDKPWEDEGCSPSQSAPSNPASLFGDTLLFNFIFLFYGHPSNLPTCCLNMRQGQGVSVRVCECMCEHVCLCVCGVCIDGIGNLNKIK